MKLHYYGGGNGLPHGFEHALHAGCARGGRKAALAQRVHAAGSRALLHFSVESAESQTVGQSLGTVRNTGSSASARTTEVSLSRSRFVLAEKPSFRRCLEECTCKTNKPSQRELFISVITLEENREESRRARFCCGEFAFV